MDIERRTPGNTAIVLIDYVTGFASLFRSQSVQENVSGAVALAKTAVGYGVPLVVSTGPENDPRGPLNPEVAAVIWRRGQDPARHDRGPRLSWAGWFMADRRRHGAESGHLNTDGVTGGEPPGRPLPRRARSSRAWAAATGERDEDEQAGTQRRRTNPGNWPSTGSGREVDGLAEGGLHGEAAIHHERLAGDVAPGVTDEKNKGRSQF